MQMPSSVRNVKINQYRFKIHCGPFNA